MLLQGWSYIHCAVLHSTTAILESREVNKARSLKEKVPYGETEDSSDNEAESALSEDDVNVHGYDSPEVQAKHIELQYGVSIEQSGTLLVDSAQQLYQGKGVAHRVLCVFLGKIQSQ